MKVDFYFSLSVFLSIILKINFYDRQWNILLIPRFENNMNTKTTVTAVTSK